MKKIDSFWKKKSNILIWQQKPKIIQKKYNGRNYWYDDGKLNIKNCLINKNNKKHDKTAIIFMIIQKN